MTTTPTPTYMTARDLAALPDDDHRYELVAGHLVRDSPAGFRHGRITHRVAQVLGAWVQAQQAGAVCAAETGFHLRTGPDTVRAPDVGFVTQARVPDDGGPVGFFDGPPDLAVEILSPDDRMVEVLDEVGDYLDAGARQVWIVVPGANTVSVYRSVPGRSGPEVQVLTENDALVGDGPVTGFECAVREFFE